MEKGSSNSEKQVMIAIVLLFVILSLFVQWEGLFKMSKLWVTKRAIIKR